MNISGKIFRVINFRVIFRQTILYCILPLITHITVIRINFVRKIFVLEIFMQQYFCSYQMRCHIFAVYRLVKNHIKIFVTLCKMNNEIFANYGIYFQVFNFHINQAIRKYFIRDLQYIYSYRQ